ncbi:hypothetical protein ACROYT_G033048, partial [Oculina patagonica]
ECFFSQSPRDCLKSHEDTIVVCGRKKTLCYLPSTNKWYFLASMLSTRHPFAYTMSSFHNKLFVVGQPMDPDGSVTECYDPSHNQWTSTKAPEVVKLFSAAVTLQGFLYIVGGEDKDDNQISTVQKFNPDTNQWQQVSSLSSPRRSVCAVADGSYLYAIGGIIGHGEYLDIVERYNPRSNTWEKLPSTHAKRASAGGAAFKQKVFVFGGLSKQSTAGDPCEMYDPDTNMWSSIPSAVAPRNYASAVSFQGKIYVFGIFQNEPIRQHMSLGVYDIDKNEWHYCMGLKLPHGHKGTHISPLRISRDVLAKCKEAISSATS